MRDVSSCLYSIYHWTCCFNIGKRQSDRVFIFKSFFIHSSQVHRYSGNSPFSFFINIFSLVHYMHLIHETLSISRRSANLNRPKPKQLYLSQIVPFPINFSRPKMYARNVKRKIKTQIENITSGLRIIAFSIYIHL